MRGRRGTGRRASWCERGMGGLGGIRRWWPWLCSSRRGGGGEPGAGSREREISSAAKEPGTSAACPLSNPLARGKALPSLIRFLTRKTYFILKNDRHVLQDNKIQALWNFRGTEEAYMNLIDINLFTRKKHRKRGGGDP
jgi:hypothetical protein